MLNMREYQAEVIEFDRFEILVTINIFSPTTYSLLGHTPDGETFIRSTNYPDYNAALSAARSLCEEGRLFSTEGWEYFRED